ncbi:ABC transporter permease [Promicromonospora panici]|uniref:ABC transporter permease n=1 Tax=Promicromonospora panici TaxID=2219658 RepID=UPI00101C0C9A|nr:ABC transporter permease [Promicromonospora panici]
MSAAATGAATSTATGASSVSVARVVRAEWTKFRTLPSNLITVAITFVTIVGLAGVLLAASDDGGTALAPVDLLAGVSWAQFLPAVLGIVAICSEWAAGTSRVTFLAVPTRWPVLAGKVAVVGVVTFVAGAAAAAGALAMGAAAGVDVGADPALAIRLVSGTGLYLGTIAVFALGVGAIVRNLVGSILTAVGFLWIAPFAAVMIPVPEVHELAGYLPTSAGALLLTPDNPAVELTPWGGYAVLLAWAAAALAGALLTLRVRDV